MRTHIAFLLALVCVLGLAGCSQQEQQDITVPTEGYTYEKLSELPPEELLDLFIQNGMVINDDLTAAFTEEELQALFKENFYLWHTGASTYSHTMYCDLAEQTKEIFDKITE